jgi:hypothetical protein
MTWMGAAALGFTLAACGSSDKSSAAGQGLTESVSASAVTIHDSSSAPQSGTTAVQADGTFSLDVSGMEGPYLLRLEWADAGVTKRLYGVSEGTGNVDVNPLTDLGFRSAHDDATDPTMADDDALDDHDFEHPSSAGNHGVATRSRKLLAELSVALAPLFQRYGITDPRTDRDAVRLLLRDVKLTLNHRLVTVTNRATGGVIFTGRLSRLSEGTFTAANMPAGPGGGSATCTSFTYSAYGACQADSTQTRTVATSLPAGCTGGAPVTSQACTYVPPTNACTSFTYSAYGACQADSTQTRTVLTSLPAGCTGGAPVTSQACVYTPPLDGAALYTQNCATCHGNSKKGRPASAIQGAIDADVGNMGSPALRALTPAQIAAIAAAP